jgi:hypothetical protein
MRELKIYEKDNLSGITDFIILNKIYRYKQFWRKNYLEVDGF